jgi:hypothetical protein
MEGYEVISSDDSKVGEAVAVRDDFLIVESGLLRKSRHAVPLAFVHADDGERVVRLTVSKELVGNSPALKNSELDRTAVAAHYGLAESEVAPETKGYGDLAPDDPAWGVEHDELRSGVEPAAQRRARIREGESEPGPHGRPVIPPDSHEGP